MTRHCCAGGPRPARTGRFARWWTAMVRWCGGRRCGRRAGDRGLAEEAAQQVFADLARKAPVLAALGRPLGPWLHRSAVYEAVQVLRREIRHRERMKHAPSPDDASPPDPWEDIRPHLDDALNSLNEADRRVLLLHWFERRTFAEAAESLGCTPAAAQRRGLRALDKLGEALRRRGVTAGAALLGCGACSAARGTSAVSSRSGDMLCRLRRDCIRGHFILSPMHSRHGFCETDNCSRPAGLRRASAGRPVGGRRVRGPASTTCGRWPGRRFPATFLCGRACPHRGSRPVRGAGPHAGAGGDPPAAG